MFVFRHQKFIPRSICFVG